MSGKTPGQSAEFPKRKFGGSPGLARGGYLTTGEVAGLLGVQPDTVLKWVRSGRLAAWRTAGGHCRIDACDAQRLLETRGQKSGGAVRCWEHFSEAGKVRDACAECVVYRARAERCWELARAGAEMGHKAEFCATECGACPYYRQAHGLAERVLVVSADERLRERLSSMTDGGVEFAFAGGAYAASKMVGEFLPVVVAVDEELAEREELLRSIREDARVPWVRIVNIARNCSERELRGMIRRPLLQERIGRT